ncbi:hypothetical protein BDV28DRAFT_150580 [Aspergillus coremiiformis]|uniref:Uncharacterized protein n=1 Tax=Aspergillus coremiiformis TaxID=138285 RepID=A0A5N6YZI0_9EURO|nr:hypothetical protein BDV28DRAFT_150580 [Aspergillus coremiiformis]
MFVPFIGLIVALTFLGARFNIPGLKELTDRHEHPLVRLSSAACIASEANTILDVVNVAQRAYFASTPKDLAPYSPTGNLQCPISREELITQRDIIVLDDTEKSLIALNPVCYEEDKPTWWSDGNDSDSSTLSLLLRQLLDVVLVLCGICTANAQYITEWWSSARSSESSSDTFSETPGHCPEAPPEQSWAEQTEQADQCEQPRTEKVEQPGQPKKKHNRPSKAKRLRYARRLQAEMDRQDEQADHAEQPEKPERAEQPEPPENPDPAEQPKKKKNRPSKAARMRHMRRLQAAKERQEGEAEGIEESSAEGEETPASLEHT